MVYYGYYLIDFYNQTLYIGQTNDLDRREQEHFNEGKKFLRIEMKQKFATEQQSLNWERSELARYRALHGRNPKYNQALNG